MTHVRHILCHLSKFTPHNIYLLSSEQIILTCMCEVTTQFWRGLCYKFLHQKIRQYFNTLPTHPVKLQDILHFFSFNLHKHCARSGFVLSIPCTSCSMTRRAVRIVEYIRIRGICLPLGRPVEFV
jgi:hypothetical protein